AEPNPAILPAPGSFSTPSNVSGPRRLLQRLQPVHEEPADLIGPFLLDPVTASGEDVAAPQVRQGVGKAGDGPGPPHGRTVLLPSDEQGRNPDRRAPPRLEVLPVPVHVAVTVEGCPETGPLELTGVESEVVLGEPAGQRAGGGKAVSQHRAASHGSNGPS